MQNRVTQQFLIDWFTQHLYHNGEVVWDIYFKLTNKQYTLPYMWTTWVINSLLYGASHPLDPKEWICEYDSTKIILYNRVGELLRDDRSQVFQSPVSIAVNNFEEFKCYTLLPQHRWWEAPFVCPYCNSLSIPAQPCRHLVVFDNWVPPGYQSSILTRQLQSLFFRLNNRNYANYRHPSFCIKIQRDYYGNLEWFRSACWYVKSPSDIAILEKVLDDDR
jgi:hypothetical protein